MVRILHFSDIHFGVPDYGNSARVLKEFETTVKQRQEPDLCVFSGDLTHSGSRTQFIQAQEWLVKLFSGWKCPLFIVPGNHDISRPADPQVLKSLRTVRSLIRTESQYKAAYADIVQDTDRSRLSNFFDFHESLKRELRLVSNWSHAEFFGTDYRFDVNGISVSICGLNSAALSFDNEDRGNLIVDETTFNGMLCKYDSRTELILAVAHHPIGGTSKEHRRWLAGWNAHRAERLLLQDTGPHMFLHGHVHRQDAQYRSMNTGQHVYTFGAGATYSNDKDYPLKFGYYDVDLSAGEIKPTIFVFEENPGRWRESNAESNHIFSALPRVAGAAKPVTAQCHGHSKTGLQACIDSYCNGSPGSGLLEQLFLRGCRDVAKWVKQHEEGYMEVHTSLLYLSIIEAFQHNTAIRIIDHDINRWNELVYEDDKIVYNTFNYSRDILLYTIAAAKRHEKYSLQRVFLLDKSKDFKDGIVAPRIIQILQKIQSGTAQCHGKIETRVCVPYDDDSGIDIILRNQLKAVEDVVFFSGSAGQYVFREKFHFMNRRRAEETKSEVSIRPADLAETPEIHAAVFELALDVGDFLDRYARTGAPGDPS